MFVMCVLMWWQDVGVALRLTKERNKLTKKEMLFKLQSMFAGKVVRLLCLPCDVRSNSSDVN